MAKIAEELDFELVMVTNEDGLGGPGFLEDDIWPVQQCIIKAFANEGVSVEKVIIDKTFAKDNAATRKPNTGLLTQYFSPVYDLESSFVIGDRLTDVELAKNLGAKGIYINDNRYLGADEISVNRGDLDSCIALETNDWKQIYQFLKLSSRVVEITRKTNETDIYIKVNLDGTGKSEIDTGIAFSDHMLDQIARHGKLDLVIK